jgi:ABC-type multidrug transport system ATPase subunit
VLVARALLDIISRLRDRGKCILFSTHIMREAERMCDRIAILHRGGFLAQGTAEQLLGQSDVPDLEELFFALISHYEQQRQTEVAKDEPARPVDDGPRPHFPGVRRRRRRLLARLMGRRTDDRVRQDIERQP